MTQKWDIVGGGLAGYVAANYLTKTDLSILILGKGKMLAGGVEQIRFITSILI